MSTALYERFGEQKCIVSQNEHRFKMIAGHRLKGCVKKNIFVPQYTAKFINGRWRNN